MCQWVPDNHGSCRESHPTYECQTDEESQGGQSSRGIKTAKGANSEQTRRKTCRERPVIKKRLLASNNRWLQRIAIDPAFLAFLPPAEHLCNGTIFPPSPRPPSRPPTQPPTAQVGDGSVSDCQETSEEDNSIVVIDQPLEAGQFGFLGAIINDSKKEWL